ncbi:MAG: MsnO8 family LLM class oxidoreductase, partial [Pseudoclavibacter sp.]
MRISLLDRSRTRAGESDAETVAATVERAVRADALGFHRFWTAEHHAVPGIASGSPTVLLAAIGSRTTRIRIGTGGVMVPNHSPIVIAEQAALLESLYPERIDLGLGASLGFTPVVRRALRRTTLGDGDVASDIAEVRSYLEGDAEVTIRPRTTPPPIFMLAITNGLALAAELGLPAVVGGPLLRNRGAIDAYFRDFRPRASRDTPSLIASVDVSIADTPERARELLLPEAWAFAHSREI